MIRVYKAVDHESLVKKVIAENTASKPSNTLLGYLPYLTLRDSLVGLTTWFKVWLVFLVFLGLYFGALKFGAPHLGIDPDAVRGRASDLWEATPFWVWIPALVGVILWGNRGNMWIFPEVSPITCIGFALGLAAFLLVLSYTTGILTLVLLTAWISAGLTFEYFQDLGRENYERLVENQPGEARRKLRPGEDQ